MSEPCIRRIAEDDINEHVKASTIALRTISKRRHTHLWMFFEAILFHLLPGKETSVDQDLLIFPKDRTLY